MNHRQSQYLIIGILILLLASLILFFRHDIENFVSSNKKSTNQQQSTSGPDFSDENFKVDYEIKPYFGSKITLDNQKAVNHVLKNWRILDDEGITPSNKDKWTGVNKIRVEFFIPQASDSTQSARLFTITDNPVNDNGILSMKINVKEDVTKDPRNSVDSMLIEFLRGIYIVKNPLASVDAINLGVEKAYSELKGYYNDYFKISYQ